MDMLNILIIINIFKKHNKVWDKVKNLFRREFDSEPVYNNKYINTKIKFTIIKYNKMQ